VPDQAVNTIFTIGHSTRPLAEFIRIIRNYRVQRVVDIRTVPRSRYNPQYNTDTLTGELAVAGLAYQTAPGLGGLRHARPDSLNTGWRNASFRGFADYMQTPSFVLNLEWLIDLARREIIVIMCAEAVPWRCHRSLIADALVMRGIRVEHIMSLTSRKAHTLTPWARVEADRITYPAAAIAEPPQNRDQMV
jgi:uncharacterized protein (DUF488 family)